MFERASNGWELAKSSWRVLKMDKELLVFPLLSGLACLVVLASFALPLRGTDYVHAVLEEEGAPTDPVAWLLLLAFYFANYFVIVYFNAALIACAIIRFRGGDPTLADGFRAATSRLPQILAWAALTATVGTVVKVIESRSERLGRVAAGLFGMAWSALTYFVVPVLVVEKVGPVAAVRRSLSILRKAWGEALAAEFGIGLIVFLAIVVAAIPAGLGLLFGQVAATMIGVGLSAVLIVLVALVSSALNSIVVAALYDYAVGHAPAAAFDADALRGAFVAR